MRSAGCSQCAAPPWPSSPGFPSRRFCDPARKINGPSSDVLGHLLSCDEETLRRFRLIARGRADRIVWFESMAYADRFNARTVARTRRYGLAALLRRMARAHAELVERLRRLPARTLRDPSHKYTVVDWLPVPGWTHERDHMGEVRRWWRARRAELRGR